MEILSVGQKNIRVQPHTEFTSNVAIVYSSKEIQPLILQNIYDLLKQVAQGCHMAFSVVHQRYAPIIGKYLNHLGYTDKYLHDDIIQDIFMILWSKRQRWEGVQNFEGYLFIMVRNILINESGKTKRHQVSPIQIESLEDISDSNPLENIDCREIMRIYYKGVHLLPRQAKAVCFLNERGMKVREIARTLGISPNTVKNHQRLATRKLREWLAQHIN